MINTIIEETRIIINNNPQVKEACEKGLSIFNNSLFKDNVEAYISISEVTETKANDLNLYSIGKMIEGCLIDVDKRLLKFPNGEIRTVISMFSMKHHDDCNEQLNELRKPSKE